MPPSRSMSWPPTPQIDQMAKNQKHYEKVHEKKSIKSFKECIKSIKEHVRNREECIENFKARIKVDEMIKIYNKKKTTETASSQVAI